MHAVSCSQYLDSTAGCGSAPDSLSQLISVKPKRAAAARSWTVSSAQYLSHEGGCGSCPDKLSHEASVNPNTLAAACSLLQSAGSVIAVQANVYNKSKCNSLAIYRRMRRQIDNGYWQHHLNPVAREESPDNA